MASELTIGEALSDARERLAKTSESPRLDAELLLAQALDVARSYLLAHPEDTLDEAAAKRFAERIAHRSEGQPMAYLTGEREFWSLSLMVSPATLIPRPETELLVELALSELPRRETRRIADLGTGSGAIALAIARERPLSTVVATDISQPALEVAAENARQHDIDNVEFLCGDWTAPLGERRFDVIVSNPPYVRGDDPALAALRYEPPSALVGGDDGLQALRVLTDTCREFIDARGALLLEHGADQQTDVQRLLMQHGWQDVRGHSDLAGQPRVTVARAPAT